MKRQDRLGRFGFECVIGGIAARRDAAVSFLVVVDSADVDDVVGDITRL